MNRTSIDKSEQVAAGSSDLRNTNPWLASYGTDVARDDRASETRSATRSSRAAALNLHLGAGVVVAVVLMIAITSTTGVPAEATSASPGHPLDHNGDIAMSSANLDQYFAMLEERATARQFLLTEIGAGEKGELIRMAYFLREHPTTVAQIIGHADDRADNRPVDIPVQQPELTR